MPSSTETDVLVRSATPVDARICGRICYDAFAAINARHNFPCDFPNVHVAIAMVEMVFSTPGFYAVVAEVDGRVVGSNVLDERCTIKGIGPITVDPQFQNSGVGRKLMQAAIDRANAQNAAGIRLVQAAFHNRSLALYAELGFDVREPLCCLQGATRTRTVPGCEVRSAEPADIDACNALSVRTHGFNRGSDLERCIKHGSARVVERDGNITGYATDLSFFGHGTCESNQDLQALLASADAFGGPGILVPTRNTDLLRWCLSNGLRITQPLTLMSIGLYNEPRGAWFPSILF